MVDDGFDIIDAAVGNILSMSVLTTICDVIVELIDLFVSIAVVVYLFYANSFNVNFC